MYTLYFAYAVYGFAFSFLSLSVQYELVNTYHFSPSKLAIVWSTVSLPWAFKPIYGFLSDRVGRRVCISAGAFFAGNVHDMRKAGQQPSERVRIMMMASGNALRPPSNIDTQAQATGNGLVGMPMPAVMHPIQFAPPGMQCHDALCWALSPTLMDGIRNLRKF